MIKRWTMPVAACAFLAVALGAGTKIKSFSCCGSGMTENPDVDGMAMLKYTAGQFETDVHVVATGLLPNTTYGVKLESDGGGFSDPLAFTTNPAGNGNYKTTVIQDRTGHPRVTIFLWDGDPDPDAVDNVTAGEQRAVGAAL